jgi:hypothetical protein
MASTAWAVLVGIQCYKNESVDPVTGAGRDVDRMFELFTKEMGVSEDRIIVLKACLCVSSGYGSVSEGV